MAKIILGKVIGPEGKAATIEVDSTETVAPDSPAVVENIGTANEAKLKFSIPQGAKGDTGATPNLSFEVKSLDPEDAPTVSVSGDPENPSAEANEPERMNTSLLSESRFRRDSTRPKGERAMLISWL